MEPTDTTRDDLLALVNTDALGWFQHVQFQVDSLSMAVTKYKGQFESGPDVVRKWKAIQTLVTKLQQPVFFLDQAVGLAADLAALVNMGQASPSQNG